MCIIHKGFSGFWAVLPASKSLHPDSVPLHTPLRIIHLTSGCEKTHFLGSKSQNRLWGML